MHVQNKIYENFVDETIQKQKGSLKPPYLALLHVKGWTIFTVVLSDRCVANKFFTQNLQ